MLLSSERERSKRTGKVGNKRSCHHGKKSKYNLANQGDDMS
jgi:hypothetical protein